MITHKCLSISKLGPIFVSKLTYYHMAELATALEFAKTAAEEFIDAAACGDHEGVSALLSSPSITMAESINALDKDGRSAFHYACLNDDVPMLTLLLNDDRTDVLLTSPRGESGLHMR